MTAATDVDVDADDGEPRPVGEPPSPGDGLSGATADRPEPVDQVTPPRSGGGGIGWVFVGFTLAALVLRLIDLGGRPLHHDESLDAWWSWRFLRGEYEGYDPVYHGPLRFYVTGGLYWLLGVGDTTVRLLPALAGTAMVAMPYWLRRQMGTTAAILASAFLAFSPSFLYFSRFGREDATIAAIFLAITVVTFRFFDEPRPWHPPAAFLLLAAGLAVKENVFMFVGVAGSFLLVALAVQAATSRPGGAARVQRAAMAVSPLSLVAALFMDRTFWWVGIALALMGLAAVGWLERRAGRETRMGIPLLGANLLFLLAAALGAGEPLFLWLFAWGGVVVALLVWALVGWSSDPERRPVQMLQALASIGWIPWVVALAVFAVAGQIWFTVFFTGETDLVSGLTDGIEYWRSQQDVNRGGQPWFYYLYVLPAYEWLAIGLAVVGGFRVWRRPSLLGGFLVWSSIANLILYSYAGERMPWLVLHPMLPIVLLAAFGGADLWDRRRSVGGALAVGLVGAAAIVTVWTGLVTTYSRAAEPAELFSQAGQATPALVTTVERVRALEAAVQRELGRPAVVVVDTTQDGGWPYPWYFRNRGYDYRDLSSEPLPPGADIVIVGSGNYAAVEAQLAGYEATDIEHRWWWVPSPDYHAGWFAGWSDWFLHRRPFSATGSIRETVFVSPEVAAIERSDVAFGGS